MDKPLIDWFTVLAQIINFLVLVALLKYFLYGRIIKAMDEREQKISSRLQEADEMKEEAGEELTAYQTKIRQWENAKEQRIAQMREEVERLKKDHLRKSREEVDLQRVRWHEALQQELGVFSLELRQQVAEEVAQIARRTLADLANADLEVQIGGVFLAHLQNLPAEDRQRLVQAFREVGEPPIVESAFEMAQPLKQAVIQTIQEQFPEAKEFRFMSNPTLMCGVELSAGGCKVSWSLNSYLDQLEQKVTTEITQRAQLSRRALEGKQRTSESMKFTGGQELGGE